MSLQIRRGTEAERLTITPLTAELIYTTDTQLVYVGDGTTAGGILVGSGGGNGNYGNANVVALLNSGLAGNIIPTVDNLYSLGNSTRQWADLYVSNNTIYMNNVPLSGNATTLSYAGVPLVAETSSSNITTTGNVSAAFFIGDGGFLSNVGGGGSYSNADVALYLPTYTGNLAGGNVLLSGTTSLIEAAGTIAILPSAGNTVDLGTTRLMGDITPVNAMGGNVGTAALPFFSGQFVNVLGDTITSTGEVTGAHIIGEGGNLSNITAANITGQVANALVAGTVYEAAQPNVTSVGTLDDLTTVGNITVGAGGFYLGDGGLLSNVAANVVSIPAVYFNVTADGNNQTFSNSFLSAYTSNTEITLFYNGALLDSPYYTFSGDTLTINTELEIGDSIDVIRQFASTAVVSTYSNANVLSYLASGSIGNIVPVGNNVVSLGNATNQWKDLWVSNATIYFDGLPLSVNAGNALTFDGDKLLVSGDDFSVGNMAAGNITVAGFVSADVFSGNVANFTSNIAAGSFLSDNYLYANGVPISFDGTYANANVANYLPTYTGNLDNVDTIATTGNVTVGTGAFFLGDGGLLSNVASAYGNANVANYLPTYTGNLDNVNVLTANTISSNATIIANSVTLGSPITPVSTSQWVKLTAASAVPVVLMTIPATDVTHIDFNVVATDTTASSRQVSKLMAINYNSTVDYNEYGSLSIGSIVGDFTVSTNGTNIFLNVIPVDSNSVNYNVVAMIYY
jgi:hypothetical protein